MDRSDIFGRPLVARRALGAWLVLLSALPLGLRGYYTNPHIGLGVWNPGEWNMGINYRAYHVAAEAARAGKDFYAVHVPGVEWAVYLYPPITVVPFYPFTLVEWTTGYAIMTGLSVLAGVAGTALIVDYVEDVGRPIGWLDVALILALFLLSTHVMGSIYYGNINLLLAFAFAVGFWALANGRDRLAGAAFGAAALYKVFPALVGVWLLRDRRWVATAAAAATGLGGLVAGAALFGPRTTWVYFTDVLAGRSGSTAFIGGYPVDGTYYVTVQRPLSHVLWTVWPGAPYPVLVGLAVVAGAAVLAYFYRDVRDRRDRLMAIFATAVVAVVLFPSFRFYLVLLYLPLVALLYVWEDGPGRTAFVAGGLLTSFTFRPGDVVELIAWLPDPVYALGYFVGGFATAQLYGLALMLAGCAWYKHHSAAERDGIAEHLRAVVGWDAAGRPDDARS